MNRSGGITDPVAPRALSPVCGGADLAALDGPKTPGEQAATGVAAGGCSPQREPRAMLRQRAVSRGCGAQ